MKICVVFDKQIF